MCGRFALDVHGETVFSSFDWLDRSRSKVDVGPNRNVTPTTSMPVIGARKERQPTLQTMGWGVRAERDGTKGRPVINARVETLHSRPMFRSAFVGATRRCLVPASGYYEWYDAGEGKKAYYGVDARGQLLLMAGLYQKTGDGLFGFVVVTRPAVGAIADHHPRMPLLVNDGDHERWLREPDPREALQEKDVPLAWRVRDPLKKDES